MINSWTVEAWERDRFRHPLLGEHVPEADIERLWDDSAAHYDCARYASIVSNVIAKLHSEGLLSGTVLDIGCGPGTFAIPFSRRANKIIALDSSRPMLERLKETCASEGITNINPVEADCKSIPEDIRCDLAFSSLCPPMNNPQSILSMEKHGKVCAYLSSANTGTSIEIEIWSELGEDYSYMGYHTEYPRHFLQSQRRKPELIFYSQEYRIDEDETAVTSRHLASMARFRPITDEIRNAVMSVVSRHSENGRVRINGKTIMGLLIWQSEY